MANIQADKQEQGADWPGIYLGLEHHIFDPAKSSEAYGWLKDFKQDSDGIWAHEDGLTDLGRDAIKNKRFKYTSFVADPSDLEKLGGNRARVLRIENVGLTNQANGRELLKPIVNRGESKERPSANQHEEQIKNRAERSQLYQRTMAKVTNRNKDEFPPKEGKGHGTTLLDVMFQRGKTRPEPMDPDFAKTKGSKPVAHRARYDLEAASIAHMDKTGDHLIKAHKEVQKANPELRKAIRFERESKDVAPDKPAKDFMVSNDPLINFFGALTEVRQIANCSYPDATRRAARLYPELWDAIPDDDAVKVLLQGVVNADRIENRASSGVEIAKHGHAEIATVQKIQNRAAQLRADFPYLSHASALIQAQRELSQALPTTTTPDE